MENEILTSENYDLEDMALHAEECGHHIFEPDAMNYDEPIEIIEQ